MKSLLLPFAMATALLNHEPRDYGSYNKKECMPNDPSWKRKKCKSCKSIQYCGKKPTSSACKDYKSK